jgi:hypothetical protein
MDDAEPLLQISSTEAAISTLENHKERLEYIIESMPFSKFSEWQQDKTRAELIGMVADITDAIKDLKRLKDSL